MFTQSFRPVSTEQLRIGDHITVLHDEHYGIVHTLRGTIATIQVSGGVTYYWTKEGSLLVAYVEGLNNPRILLSDMFTHSDEDIEAFTDSVRERLF
jgi:hypothetical protein